MGGGRRSCAANEIDTEKGRIDPCVEIGQAVSFRGDDGCDHISGRRRWRGGLEAEEKKEQGVCRLGKEHLFFWTSKKQNKQNSNNCFEYQQPRSLVGPSLCGYCLAPSVLLSQRLVPMPMPTQGPRRIKVTNPDQTDACVETMAVWAGPRGSGARTAVSVGWANQHQITRRL